jgi:sugar (pentulose or hexulose) kinase
VKAASSAVIGLDIGTSVVKGVLVAADGNLMARAGRSQRVDIGRGGRVEIDAVLVTRNVRRVIARLAGRAASDGFRVRAVCAGGSGDEGVWVDDAGVPVAPVPLSLDTRDTAVGEAIVTRVGAERFRSLTGLPTSGAYPITRYAALRAAQPELAARVERLLAWPESLALDLGVEVMSEPTLAARSGAWRVAVDGRGARYDRDLLAAAGVSASLLPPVIQTGSVIGTIPARVADTLGLPGDVDLVAGGFDQAMATLGAAITTSGVAHVGAGSWQALTLLADERPHTDVVADGFSVGPSVAAQGRWSAMASGPGAIMLGWLGRVGDGAGDPAKRMAALARRAADEPTGLTVIPDLGGGAPPHPDPRARGVIAGLGLGDGAERLARALLEGVAIGLRERLERAAAAGLAVGEIRTTGGGARDAGWRQLTADVTGLPVRTVDPPDAGAVAAAALASVAAGLAPDVVSALARMVRLGRPLAPRPGHHAAYQGIAERLATLRSDIAAVHDTDADT